MAVGFLNGNQEVADRFMEFKEQARLFYADLFAVPIARPVTDYPRYCLDVLQVIEDFMASLD